MKDSLTSKRSLLTTMKSKGTIIGKLVVTLVAYLGLRALMAWIRSLGGLFARWGSEIGLGADVAKGAGSLCVLLLTVALVVLFAYATGYRSRDLGLGTRGALRCYCEGVAISVAMIGAIVLLGLATGGVRFEGFGRGELGAVEFVALMLLAMLNVREELLFRGWMLADMRSYLPVGVAIVASSVLFGVGHLSNPHVTTLAIVNLTLLGIFWALCFVRTGSLWLLMAMHSFWNFIQSYVVGLPMSGMASSRSLLHLSGVDRGAFATDSFGLEGSLSMTVVVGVAIVVVLLIGGRRERQRR